MFALNRVPFLRDRGWTPVDADDYRAAWQRWGGSVRTHPDFVERISALLGIEVRYLGWFVGTELKAAIPTWGCRVALDKRVLKQRGVDLGSAETLLPVAPDGEIRLAHLTRHLSGLHAGRIRHLHGLDKPSAFIREPEQYRAKFLSNRRRELRIVQDNGGELAPVSTLASPELADVYTALFEKRWGFDVPGKRHLGELFSLLDPFIAGNLLTLHGEPVAIDLLYRVDSPQWVSVECINRGIDPAFRRFSPGSVLMFVNTQAEWQRARGQGKALRYSLGHYDASSPADAYKQHWCNIVTAYRT